MNGGREGVNEIAMFSSLGGGAVNGSVNEIAMFSSPWGGAAAPRRLSSGIMTTLLTDPCFSACFQPGLIPPTGGVGRGSGLYDILIKMGAANGGGVLGITSSQHQKAWWSPTNEAAAALEPWSRKQGKC